eukprot:m.128804 g.128804  ORF g.128804 m.128804 type:complete len:90 (-) comp29358_c6_seq1:33-302(-)
MNKNIKRVSVASSISDFKIEYRNEEDGEDERNRNWEGRQSRKKQTRSSTHPATKWNKEGVSESGRKRNKLQQKQKHELAACSGNAQLKS